MPPATSWAGLSLPDTTLLQQHSRSAINLATPQPSIPQVFMGLLLYVCLGAAHSLSLVFVTFLRGRSACAYGYFVNGDTEAKDNTSRHPSSLSWEEAPVCLLSKLHSLLHDAGNLDFSVCKMGWIIIYFDIPPQELVFRAQRKLCVCK